MYYFIKNKRHKDLVYLSLIYLMSQGVLLIVSGRWWDDWVFFEIPFWSLKNMGLEMGRPSLIPIMMLANSLPESGYRILTFVFFFFSSLWFYKIIKICLGLEWRSAFWISALFITVPVNDSRILLSVFPYTVGFFFFMAGFSYLVGKLYEESLGLFQRVICWGLFLISFIFNSVLFFYELVLLAIIFHEKDVRRIMRYIDFAILPAIFFVVKSLLFPSYGAYAGYNHLSVRGLIKAALLTIPADVSTMGSVINNNTMYGYAVFGLIAVSAIYIWNLKHKKIDDNYCGFENEIILCAVGLLTLSAGLFPYVVVRQSYIITTSGIGGRDAALAGAGVAILVYSIIDWCFKDHIKKYVYIWFILCGSLFFGTFYMSYQQDYYRQLGFQQQLSLHQNELKDAKCIVYYNDDISLVNVSHFYQLNGIAEKVFGDQSKFILGGVGDSVYLYEDTGSLDYFIDSGRYHMSEYDRDHKTIDAVVEYSFDSQIHDVIRMKYYEMIGSSEFDEELASRTDMKILNEGTTEFEQFFKQHSD